jgi:hypothetical protein
MKTPLLVLALVLSSLSLGLQLKNVRTTPLFDKYLVPARISDYDYRKVLADTRMIQDSAIMNNGVGVPFVFRLSDDHQRIICRVDVSEKDLPKSHDEQKKVLDQTAWMAVGDVASAFDLVEDKSMPHAVKVEFRSIEGMVKKGAEAENYAEFSDGQLTFH